MYDDYWQHLELLGDVEKGHLLQAIYAHRGMCKAPVLSAGEKMALSFIRAQLDRDEDRYILKCETNRANVLKRWGREDTGECGRIPGDTNNTHTDTNTDTDTDTDKKMDKSGGKAQASPQGRQDGTGPESQEPPCGVAALATGYTTDPHLMEALGAFVAMRREMEKKSHGRRRLPCGHCATYWRSWTGWHRAAATGTGTKPSALTRAPPTAGGMCLR